MEQFKKRLGRVLAKATLAAAAILCIGTADAQSERIRFADRTVTVRQAFADIEQQTRFRFAYSSTSFDTGRQVTLPAAEMNLSEAMDRLLEGSGFEYRFLNDNISIRRTGEKPAPALQFKPRTGDRYFPSDMNSLGTASRKRPLSPPRIEIADTTRVRPDSKRSEELPEFYSHIKPVGSYLGNKLNAASLKINLLYGAGTLTPNLAAEIGLGKTTSLELSGSYNPWNLSGSLESNRKMVHMIIRPEFRYWLCERFNGHFFGVHGMFARYNVGSYDIPLLFEKEYRYDGIGIGGGLTYGYHWTWSKHWGMEFNIGLGAVWMKYDRYDCAACNYDFETRQRVYFGPTRAGITLVFMIK